MKVYFCRSVNESILCRSVNVGILCRSVNEGVLAGVKMKVYSAGV